MSTSLCHSQGPQLVQQQMIVQQPDSEQQPHSVQQRDSQQLCLSFREKRRIEQSQRANDKKTRGPTRAKKWHKERDRWPGTKPSCTINRDMKRIVGPNADQFVTEVATWVKTFLPFKCRNWKDMDSRKKERLFNKIKVEWNLPEGDYVDQAVKTQCQTLYREWRCRMKTDYFKGFSIAEAISNCPKEIDKDEWKWVVQRYWGSDKQKRISETNRRNRFKQKVKGVQGRTSTTRILEVLRKKNDAGNSSQNIQVEDTQASQDAIVGSTEVPSLPPPDPEYIRLWEMTKRRKDNSWDTIAEQKLQEFKELHKEQTELHGVDNLTVQEAYLRVLGTSSGYINGLGFGPKPPKCNKEGRSDGGGMEIAHQMAAQLEQMEKKSREREAGIKDRLEKEAKEREAQLKDELRQQSAGRETKLMGEIQRLQQDKAEMRGEVEKMKRDAEEREARMKAMEEKIAALCAANIKI